MTFDEAVGAVEMVITDRARLYHLDMNQVEEVWSPVGPQAQETHLFLV